MPILYDRVRHLRPSRALSLQEGSETRLRVYRLDWEMRWCSQQAFALSTRG